MSQEQLKLDNQLCFRLYTASRLVTQAYEPFFRDLGITYTQYLVLLVLWEKDCQPINTIGRRLKLGINTTSPLIKRMETLGLVSRTDDDADKRKQIVCLTEKGKALEEQAAKIPGCLAISMQGCGVNLKFLEKLYPALDDFIEAMSQKD